MTDRQASIVPISPAHAPGYRAALDEVARERKYLTSLEAPPVESSEAFVNGNIASGNPHFVALVDGVVVGWCDIYRESHPWARHAGVLGMGVVAAHRGRGIGKRLIGATIEAADAAGFHRLELEVFSTNTTAIALYERVGFTHEGRRRDAYLMSTGYCDLLIMSRLVTADRGL